MGFMRKEPPCLIGATSPFELFIWCNYTAFHKHCQPFGTPQREAESPFPLGGLHFRQVCSRSSVRIFHIGEIIKNAVFSHERGKCNLDFFLEHSISLIAARLSPVAIGSGRKGPILLESAV